MQTFSVKTLEKYYMKNFTFVKWLVAGGHITARKCDIDYQKWLNNKDIPSLNSNIGMGLSKNHVHTETFTQYMAKKYKQQFIAYTTMKRIL